MIVLTPLRKFQLPVIAECINPDVFQGKTPDEIAALKLWEGNKQKTLGNLFKIEEDKAERPSITINGDVSEVRRIGMGMKEGGIVIKGNAGMHLGSKMLGGTISVHGDVGGWAGAEMRGGVIEIHGNAGDYMASSYRGSTEGMHKGKIIVHGNVGSDVAVFMNGGTIKIYGNSGQFLGFRMCSGKIFVEKTADTRVGACMTGGKIVVSGFLEEVLPTFTIDRIKSKVKIEEGEKVSGPFYVFLGDLAEKGKGKLFVSKVSNPHLSHYEKFL
ncbi:MAG: formylmethanofuran dehydrogenase subunit C [Candidatus Bathyarchaeota archaeon]|nr:MAG: formylmethanofuran dehydrogenase subunit C [Candidatus Bathyarchaeota archaeon]